MPHPHLYLLHARLVRNQHGGAGMAQVVEADARQSVLIQHFREAFADLVGTDEIAERIDADHIEVFLGVIPTVKAAVSILQFPVFP